MCMIVQYSSSPFSNFVTNTGARVLRIDSNIEFCGAKRTDDVTFFVSLYLLNVAVLIGVLSALNWSIGHRML